MAGEAAADVVPHDAVEPSAVAGRASPPSGEQDAPSSSSNEPVAPTPVEASAATASPKKKGRPPGAKDAKPRTRRPPVVRIEPIPQEQPPKEEPRAAKEESVRASAAVSQVAQTPKPEIEELPPSPRTLYRETSKNLLALRGVIHANRRSSMEATITQKLALWPLV